MTPADSLPLAILGQLGTFEIVLIFFVILLLFGAKRLPELFKSFGKSLGEFKKATRDIETDFRDAMDTAETSAPTEPPAKKPAATEARTESTNAS